MNSKFIFIFLYSITSIFSVSTAYAVVERVPYIFTGDSPAPAYQNFPKYKNKLDARDSTTFTGYHLSYATIQAVQNGRGGISRVHAHVRDIAKDGLCEGVCFRVFIYLNGDEQDGVHVATFVVSPGVGRSTPLVDNLPLRRYTRSLTTSERPTQYGNFDAYRIYNSKSYPDNIPNMPNVMFFLDAIGLHGSFGKVNGTKQSHGCIRMFPDESYFVHTLMIAAGGNITFDVLHTR